MNELIKRLEEAAEGSEELDVAIVREVFGYEKDNPLWHCLPYTTSLDAALTLVPEGTAIEMTGEAGAEGWGTRLTDDHSKETMALSTTLPLALCIAALKAREVQS